MYLSYFGIRVTNLARSLEFYTKLFGLEEVARGDNTKIGGGVFVLLKDPKSGSKLELIGIPPIPSMLLHTCQEKGSITSPSG